MKGRKTPVKEVKRIQLERFEFGLSTKSHNVHLTSDFVLSYIEDILPELQPDKDLLYIGSNVRKIHVHVLDEIYKLIGEISSSEDELQADEHLENYLIDNVIATLDSQGMARMKQTIRKQTTKTSSLPSAIQNPSNELDSDSCLERTFTAINSDEPDKSSRNTVVPIRSSPRKGKSSSSGGSGEQTNKGWKPKQPLETEEEEERETSSEESSEEEPPPKWPKTRKREDDMSAKELVAHWNQTVQVKKPTVTAQGWLKKTERQQDRQNRLLRRGKPGMQLL